MSGSWTIEGHPYTATLFPEEDTLVHSSVAVAVIEPPVTFEEDTVAIGCTLDDYPRSKTFVSHILSTTNKTFINLEVHDAEGYPSSHDERLDIARDGLKQFIGLINRIEIGTFDGTTYSIRERE